MTKTETIMDCFLTMFIFSPLIICYWAGTWQLLDIYLLPNNNIQSAFVSVGLSFFLMFGAYTLEDVLNKYTKRENVVLYFIVTRLYTYISAFAVVANWRGLWYVLDEYIGGTLFSAGISFTCGVIGLVLLRAFRNVLSPPLPMVLDLDVNQHFTVVTRFRSQKGSISFILDVLFSVCVVLTLVLVVWRGIWNLQEILIYPDDQLWQSVITATIGNVFMLVIFIAQFPARRAASRLHQSSPWLQVFLENIFVFFICYATVSYWQGMWSLLNILLEEYDYRLMMWTLHALGFGGLLLLRLGTTLQFGGVFLDGEFPDGVGLVMTVTYVKAVFKSSDAVIEVSTFPFSGLSLGILELVSSHFGRLATPEKDEHFDEHFASPVRDKVGNIEHLYSGITTDTDKSPIEKPFTSDEEVKVENSLSIAADVPVVSPSINVESSTSDTACHV